jgi:hypothetical protein
VSVKKQSSDDAGVQLTQNVSKKETNACSGIQLTEDRVMGLWSFRGSESAAKSEIRLKDDGQFTLVGLRPNNYEVNGMWEYDVVNSTITLSFAEDIEFWKNMFSHPEQSSGWEEGIQNGIPYIKLNLEKDAFATRSNCVLVFNFQGHAFSHNEAN